MRTTEEVGWFVIGIGVGMWVNWTILKNKAEEGE